MQPPNRIALRPDQQALFREAKQHIDAMTAGYQAGMRDSLAVVLKVIQAIPDPAPKQEEPPNGSSS